MFSNVLELFNMFLKRPELIKLRHFLLLTISYEGIVVQSLSSIRLFVTMNHSMPGFPVLHYFPEFTQTHVHWVGDAI